MSSFLQQALSVLDVRSPLTPRCSDDLVAELQPFHGKHCTLFSMDIKDLYYSLEPKTLLERVGSFFLNNIVRFQSQSGIGVTDFLRILELNLRATMVQNNNRDFIQKRGICIGSVVAPILLEIYLSYLDLKLHDIIRNRSPSDVLVRRYAEDLLICSTDSKLAASLEKAAFDSSPELKLSVDRLEGVAYKF